MRGSTHTCVPHHITHLGIPLNIYIYIRINNGENQPLVTNEPLWVWGVDHTNHFWHHQSSSPVITMWEAVGRHFFFNIISIDFTAGTRWKVWCDRGMRGWSHQSLLTPSVIICGCNSVKNDGPTFNSQHSPQQFHCWNRTQSLVWTWHENLTAWGRSLILLEESI